MKECRQKMKWTLSIHGQERTFSEQDLIAILEEYFHNEATEQETTAKVTQAPTEGRWFEINPQTIDQKLFQNQRRDKDQEKTRKLILEAFDRVKNNPKKYGKEFETMMPKVTQEYVGKSKIIAEVHKMASELGDHNADWIEQALEWAQRIYNGESWEAICNNPDTAEYYRLIVWKDGYPRIVGGMRNGNKFPPSYVSPFRIDYKDNSFLNVPLIVRYK